MMAHGGCLPSSIRVYNTLKIWYLTNTSFFYPHLPPRQGRYLKKIRRAVDLYAHRLRSVEKIGSPLPYNAKANAATTAATPPNAPLTCNDAASPVKGVMLEVALVAVMAVVAAATPELAAVVLVDGEPMAEARAEVEVIIVQPDEHPAAALDDGAGTPAPAPELELAGAGELLAAP